MHGDIERVLIGEADIARRVGEIAATLNEKFGDEEVYVVCVLSGSVMFYADLVRKLTFPVRLEFIKASSYGMSAVSGELKIIMDLKSDICGKNVVVVEDIIDTGNTIDKLCKMLGARKPKSLCLCALLDKPSRRTRSVSADITGFEIPDEFVVGYGLDYAERYRELPYVGVLKKSVYECE